MGMFVAPFGMLVSKWASARGASLDIRERRSHSSCWPSAAPRRSCSGPSGSASSPASPMASEENVELTVQHDGMGVARALMAVPDGRAGLRRFLPLIFADRSSVPYLASVFNGVLGQRYRQRTTCGSWPSIAHRHRGRVPSAVRRCSDRRRRSCRANVYHGRYQHAISTTRAPSWTRCRAASSRPRTRNWYMTEFFDEKKMSFVGIVVTLVLLVGSFRLRGSDRVRPGKRLERHLCRARVLRAEHLGPRWRRLPALHAVLPVLSRATTSKTSQPCSSR